MTLEAIDPVPMPVGYRARHARTLLAIDPGADGGWAWIDQDGIVQSERMPEGMTAQVDRLRELAAGSPGLVCTIEKVGGYMPGNSGPAAATFARHCGHLEAMLYALSVPVFQVAPQKWQKALGTWPKEKQDRKRAIREEMQRRHPHLRVTLKTADALGILEWARRLP
jgi:hypothetical protein